MHEDNLGTIDVLSNAVNNGRTKHIDVRHLWVRELVNKGIIRMQYIDTDKNTADFLTKPLVGQKVRAFRDAILGHVLVWAPRAAYRRIPGAVVTPPRISAATGSDTLSAQDNTRNFTPHYNCTDKPHTTKR